MPEIFLTKHADFCFGVKNALEIAQNAAKDGEVYTYGTLIHNEKVVKELEKKGVKSSDDLDFILKQKRVVIRAHGVAKSTEELIRQNVPEVFDATCPFVKKIQKTVEEYSKNGYDVIVAGSPTHPEVLGIAGYVSTKVYVAGDDFDFQKLPAGKYCVVAQTTFSVQKYDKIKKNIQKYSDTATKSVVFFDTICYTTYARQAEAEALAKSSDAVLVVGSKSSSNAKKLFDLAKSLNPNTFFISDISELRPEYYNKFITMAILAAASTPKELTMEVLIYMSETQEAKVTEAVEENKELTMEDIVSSNKSVGYMSYKAGKRIVAKIISVDENGIYVGIPGKKDGFIDKTEVTIDGTYNPADYHVGDEIEAVIVPSKTKDSTYVSLSKREIDIKKAEDAEAEKALNSSEFTLENTQVVKGGLLGKIGSYTVFVPASQIRIGYVKNLEDYTSKKLRLRALPPKEGEEEKRRNPKLIVASQRVILEEEKAAKEEAFWSTMVPGAIVSGKVKRFSAFGAFVSVKGFDCLAHISDLSWNKITDPSKVLTIGETYDFVVLKVDREAGKISLGYKQLQKKPYEIAAEKYPVGTVIKGKVERIFPFGAFVSIEDGVDGLVHVSQISHNWTKDANEVLKVGDEVEAKIIGFEDNRITLSIKELLPAPETTEEAPQATDGEAQEKPAKRAPRAKKAMDYSEAQAKSEENKQRRAKREQKAAEEQNYISDNGFATLADILGNLDIKVED